MRFSIGRWVRCGDRKRPRENQRRSDASQKSAMRCDEAGNQRSGANAVLAVSGSIFGCLFLFYRGTTSAAIVCVEMRAMPSPTSRLRPVASSRPAAATYAETASRGSLAQAKQVGHRAALYLFPCGTIITRAHSRTTTDCNSAVVCGWIQR
jgi:hypothetical protein